MSKTREEYFVGRLDRKIWLFLQLCDVEEREMKDLLRLQESEPRNEDAYHFELEIESEREEASEGSDSSEEQRRLDAADEGDEWLKVEDDRRAFERGREIALHPEVANPDSTVTRDRL